MVKRIQSLFTSRPPGFEQPLPQHGVLYFDHLNAELRSSALQAIDQELQAVIEEMRKKRGEHTLTWNDLYAFDLILTRLLPAERLSREVWSLRARYRDVAGLREYEAYLASKPPDLAGKVEEQDLRADSEYLLGQIYLRYAITPLNQQISDYISRRVTGVILCGLFIMLIAVVINMMYPDEKPSPGTPLVVLFIGAMGGLLSMQQRYQSVPREGDPVDNISELMQNWSRLFLPSISGAIFALLLYMMFIGGLVEGKLFPYFDGSRVDTANISTNSNHMGASLTSLLQHGRPKEVADYAKLIIWSFIAGFAERFVPDTLARFVSRRDVDIKRAM